MKKLLIFSIVIICILFAVGCTDAQTCENCIDGNTDGICDACGGAVSLPPHTECRDTDGDGICDVCDSELSREEYIQLVEDGAVRFSVVVASGASSVIHKRVDALIDRLDELGVELKKLSDEQGSAVGAFSKAQAHMLPVLRQ